MQTRKNIRTVLTVIGAISMLMGIASQLNLESAFLLPDLTIEEENNKIHVTILNDSFMFHQLKDVIIYIQLQDKFDKNNIHIEINDCLEGTPFVDFEKQSVVVSFERMSNGIECTLSINNIMQDSEISQSIEKIIISQENRRLVGYHGENNVKVDLENNAWWILVFLVIIIVIIPVILIKKVYDSVYFAILLSASKGYKDDPSSKKIITQIQENFDVKINNMDATILSAIHMLDITTISKISNKISLHKRYTNNRIWSLEEMGLVEITGVFVKLTDPIQNLLDN